MATWSLWHFVRNFSTRRQKITRRRIVYDALAVATLLSAYSFTPGVVEGLEFEKNELVYREVFGPFFIVHPLLHLVAIAGFAMDAVRQMKRQK